MEWQPQIPPQGAGVRYDAFGAQAGMQQPTSSMPTSMDGLLYSTSSDFMRSGLGAYGEKIFGTGRQYVQSNISQYFAGNDVQYYFQVNDQYVKNKIRVILFPFSHKGHWTRIAEQVAGGLTYKPPLYDINAPDLYIPFMAFGTYIVLCGYALGFLGRFNPEDMSLRFTKALLGWAAEVVLLRSSLYAMGSVDAPILDVISYSGYAFVGVCISVLARMMWSYSFYIVMPWTSLCMAVFLVKTLKRMLFAEARSYERDSSRQHYILLFIALAQFPLFFWLAYINNA